MTAAWSREEIEGRVLAIFERHRQTPGAAFEESHFLDWLLAAPGRKSAVHDSFAGKLRFNRFVDDVQLELCVCLSNEDLERTWTPSALAERIRHKRGNPRAGLRLVGERIVAERNAAFMPMLVLNILLGVPGLALTARTRSWPLGIAVVTALVLLNGALLVLRQRALARWRRLEEALRDACAHEVASWRPSAGQ